MLACENPLDVKCMRDLMHRPYIGVETGCRHVGARAAVAVSAPNDRPTQVFSTTDVVSIRWANTARKLSPSYTSAKRYSCHKICLHHGAALSFLRPRGTCWRHLSGLMAPRAPLLPAVFGHLRCRRARAARGVRGARERRARAARPVRRQAAAPPAPLPRHALLTHLGGLRLGQGRGDERQTDGRGRARRAAGACPPLEPERLSLWTANVVVRRAARR